MGLSVRVVCRPEIASGFELAGLRADTAVDAATTRASLAALAEDPDLGIVLIDERLLRELPAELVQRLERQPRPLLAAFPGPRFDRPEAAEEAVLEILRRAIGYRVRLP
jgi:vacuolar-type H+-ATPase subunit F/Vma7